MRPATSSRLGTRSQWRGGAPFVAQAQEPTYSMGTEKEGS